MTKAVRAAASGNGAMGLGFGERADCIFEGSNGFPFV